VTNILHIPLSNILSSFLKVKMGGILKWSCARLQIRGMVGFNNAKEDYKGVTTMDWRYKMATYQN